MFGKAKPPGGKDQLASRVRALSNAPAQQPSPGSYAGPVTREKSRSPRDPIFRNASLVTDESHKFAVVIKNLSSTGARVEFFTKLDLPEFVVLVEPTLRLRQRARVVWQRDGVAGLEFTR